MEIEPEDGGGYIKPETDGRPQCVQNQWRDGKYGYFKRGRGSFDRHTRSA